MTVDIKKKPLIYYKNILHLYILWFWYLNCRYNLQNVLKLSFWHNDIGLICGLSGSVAGFCNTWNNI